jgi:hypothetical protein
MLRNGPGEICMFRQPRSLRTFYGLVLYSMLLALSLAACGNNVGNGGNTGGAVGNGNISTPAATTAPGSASTATPQVPLNVVSVSIAVNPSSLSSSTCGTSLNVTYTATFHFPANNVGGLVKFSYTTNNGRSSTPTQLTVSPGQLTATYPFIWSGTLPADHTEPGPGGVMVTSPNSYTSPLVAPAGACSPAASGPFKVTSIELSASPSLSGTHCNTLFTETYTAIFHIAPGGPGGTIVFQYTTNNGRGSSPNISLHVAAGQTSVTYKFYWTGLLPADHTAPGTGIVLMSAPNQGESPAASPTGQCS